MPEILRGESKTGVDEEKLKKGNIASVTPDNKDSGDLSLSKLPKKPSSPPPPPPPKTDVSPKPPRPPKANVTPQKTNNNIGPKNKTETPVKSPVTEIPKTESSETEPQKEDGKFTLEEEIEIARLQCEDDDNAAVVANEDEVIEKSYKAGLSDQDKQRQKRRLRRLLLLLLLLLLFAGTVSATYFIIKNKTEYVPEFYDNVAIDMVFTMERSEDRMPGSTLILIRPIEVLVKANTEEINYDIVALGIRVTAKLTDTGEDCSDIIDVGLYDINQIYRTDDLEYTGGNYIRCGKDVMLYYKKVLEPGDNEKLINAIRINTATSNEYAKKEITVKVEVFAVYPNPAQIRADNSEFINAPQGWVEEVYEKMNNIFKERAKNR